MHEIEPYFQWRHLYMAEEDPRSIFYGRAYSEFEFSTTVYNYYIHPQWDDFGSRTLFVKVIMADYEEGYAVIELIGEWNDAIENDVMTLKREVIDKLEAHGIYKFIDYDYEYNYPDRTEKFIEINCVFNNGDLLEKNCVFNKKIVYKKLCLIINNKDNYDYYDKKTNRYTYYFNNFKIEWVYTNYNLDKYEMNFISENHFNDCLLYRTRDKPYYLTNRNDYTIL